MVLARRVLARCVPCNQAWAGLTCVNEERTIEGGRLVVRTPQWHQHNKGMDLLRNNAKAAQQRDFFGTSQYDGCELMAH
jgi:hypothetical protein